MKKESQEKDNEIREQLPPGSLGENLDEAIKRIYEQYGNDLPAFFRDAYKDAARSLQKKAPDDTEAFLM